MFLEATQIFRETLGRSTRWWRWACRTPRACRIATRRSAGAERLMREALAIQRRMFGSVTGDSLLMLAGIVDADGTGRRGGGAAPRGAGRCGGSALGANPHPALEQSLDRARQGPAPPGAPRTRPRPCCRKHRSPNQAPRARTRTQTARSDTPRIRRSPMADGSRSVAIDGHEGTTPLDRPSHEGT